MGNFLELLWLLFNSATHIVFIVHIEYIVGENIYREIDERLSFPEQFAKTNFLNLLKYEKMKTIPYRPNCGSTKFRLSIEYSPFKGCQTTLLCVLWDPLRVGEIHQELCLKSVHVTFLLL